MGNYLVEAVNVKSASAGRLAAVLIRACCSTKSCQLKAESLCVCV